MVGRCFCDVLLAGRFGRGEIGCCSLAVVFSGGWRCGRFLIGCWCGAVCFVGWLAVAFFVGIVGAGVFGMGVDCWCCWLWRLVGARVRLAGFCGWFGRLFSGSGWSACG